MAARLVDVALRAGVAPAVVSRVLNGDDSLRIRPETRERVLQAVADLRYSPHFAARALSTARTEALALVVPTIGSPLNQEILRGAHAAATNAGYTVLLGDSLLNDNAWQSVERLVREGRIDGIVFQRGNTMSDDDVRTMAGVDIPSVIINAAISGLAGTVALDDDRGIAVAVDHLSSIGHTRIGHVAGVLATDTAQRRLAAFLRSHAARGRDVPEAWIVEGGHDAAAGEAGMRVLLGARTDLPTALVVANVFAAVGVLAAAKAAGLNVPSDLSIVAFHDTWFAEFTDPPLTTVRMPLPELGALGVLELIRVIDGFERRNVLVETPVPELVARNSTAEPRAA